MLVPIAFAPLRRVATALQVPPRLALASLFDELVHALHEGVVGSTDQCAMERKVPLLELVVVSGTLVAAQAPLDFVEVVYRDRKSVVEGKSVDLGGRRI